MTDVRVYLPTTLAGLAEAYAAGGFARGSHARAASEVLEAEPGLDPEEAEYAAMQLAADDALEMLAAEDTPARVVVAADVPAGQLDAGEAGLLVTGGLPVRRWASVHLDAEDAHADLAAAVAGRAAGDADAARLAERVQEHELAWYAVQEVPHLLVPDR